VWAQPHTSEGLGRGKRPSRSMLWMLMDRDDATDPVSQGPLTSSSPDHKRKTQGPHSAAPPPLPTERRPGGSTHRGWVTRGSSPGWGAGGGTPTPPLLPRAARRVTRGSNPPPRGGGSAGRRPWCCVVSGLPGWRGGRVAPILGLWTLPRGRWRPPVHPPDVIPLNRNQPIKHQNATILSHHSSIMVHVLHKLRPPKGEGSRGSAPPSPSAPGQGPGDNHTDTESVELKNKAQKKNTTRK
jgi:hypothetical protein